MSASPENFSGVIEENRKLLEQNKKLREENQRLEAKLAPNDKKPKNK